jgi:hypothetical protein
MILSKRLSPRKESQVGTKHRSLDDAPAGISISQWKRWRESHVAAFRLCESCAGSRLLIFAKFLKSRIAAHDVEIGIESKQRWCYYAAIKRFEQILEDWTFGSRLVN